MFNKPIEIIRKRQIIIDLQQIIDRYNDYTVMGVNKTIVFFILVIFKEKYHNSAMKSLYQRITIIIIKKKVIQGFRRTGHYFSLCNNTFY